MKIDIRLYWGDGGSLFDSIDAELGLSVLKRTPIIYPTFVREGHGHYSFRRRVNDKGSAQRTVRIFQATVRFMELTKLTPSKADKAFFRDLGEYGHFPIGFDHTLLWRTKQKKLVATTEPYDDGGKLLSNLHPSLHVVKLPKGVGMWNPPACSLFLIAKKKDNIPLELFVQPIALGWGNLMRLRE